MHRHQCHESEVGLIELYAFQLMTNEDYRCDLLLVRSPRSETMTWNRGKFANH